MGDRKGTVLCSLQEGDKELSPVSLCADLCAGFRAEIDAKCIAKMEPIRYGFDKTLIKQSGNLDKTIRKYGKKLSSKESGNSE